ncbi:MAG: Gfo/Idh/MocA family oxidoreductase [Clostridiales Family XIII bacterium]|jgi:predicted dehydrogenase|nr:Gfo/Idh/MocA family oxidoreductase [Clostridiales Family XIII bacterium]
MTAKRVGIVGVGLISDIFIKNMIEMFTSTQVVGCTARNWEHIKAKAEQFNIAAMTMDEMFEDSSIDIIVNLTPAAAHHEIIKRALTNGKHVYTEKSLALNYAQADELIKLADAKGLLLGSAPDTFLGSGVQTAIRAVNDGLIGDITGYSIVLNRGLELLYEFMDFLIKPGAGIGYDFGVYALTALFSILGPADEVCGFLQTNRPLREYKTSLKNRAGEQYEIENENIMAAAIKMRNGILGTLMCKGVAVFPEIPYLSLQGTRGILYLPDPNEFGGDVIYQPGAMTPRQIRGGEQERILENHHRYSEDSRGIGVADMATSLSEGRPHRANATIQRHLLELLDGIVSSYNSKSYSKLTSDFVRPTPLTGDEVF